MISLGHTETILIRYYSASILLMLLNNTYKIYLMRYLYKNPQVDKLVSCEYTKAFACLFCQITSASQKRIYFSRCPVFNLATSLEEFLFWFARGKGYPLLYATKTCTIFTPPHTLVYIPQTLGCYITCALTQ